MVSELHSFIKTDSVIFGTRECVKRAKSLDKVFVPADIRTDALQMLEKKGLVVERLEATKHEITDKCELAFFCEAFGVKK